MREFLAEMGTIGYAPATPKCSPRYSDIGHGASGLINRAATSVRLERGFDCGVGGVSEGSGDVVLVPADALVCDRVFETAFVVVQSR